MSNIDKRALREAAEKATPGRIGDRVDGSIKYTCRGTDGTLVLSTDNHDDYGFVGDNSPEDELFFRLCDPVTVLALLDELEAAEKKALEMPTFDGYVPHVARELQAAFRIACDNAGINVTAAGKGE
ncbi:ead/Ea22-like family protein [Enterobacter chengduensis]|uniref:ead/Ea22-like family protein n=1 Tax=Enterobacteriaceae TaxID=543 RepID=UPI0025762B91|nr:MULTISPECIES: ead/Ea22-like family protein [Enterobacteriaceae]HDS5485798.1 ead/Ea22-like family protein [Enterobacter chengduensis]MDM3077796.1 ead/Ea22-like family protein [Citrobacter sp. Cf138]MDY0424928.1 ead/Ea22-like family protein [Enterobacter sp. 170250]HDS5488131.1 ead/Ea22-like family protein [Enterobacter chengduensis]HDT2588909.1 ead/Ea22-like family protein [Enterobacter chengduensis]